MNRLLLVTFTLLISACSIDKSEPIGPEGSWWVGGPDGGVFIDIKDDNISSDRIYKGTVYYDADRTVWYQGRLRLIGNLKFSPKDRASYLGWDGEKLLLIEEAYLEVMDPVEKL